jgi:hypothetical protein
MWSGHFKFQMSGEHSREYDGQVSLDRNTEDGRSVDLSGLCPNGTGTVTMSGFDGTYTWQGSLECEPATYLNGCLFTLRYTEARADVIGDTMVVHAAGRALSAMCEANVAMVLEFASTGKAQ